MQIIRMYLTQKQNIFSEFFHAVFKSALHFEHFQKKMMLIASVFSKFRTPKTWLDKRLQAPV